MNTHAHLALCLAAALWLPTAGVSQPTLYRWVDENGVVHYSDSVPPEFSNSDRAILNRQGVAVGFEEGELTDEERAELARTEAEAAARRELRAEAARRDHRLLQTYLSVAEIEDLRDRRVELLESQIKVTELYLTNLRKRLAGFEQEASRYEPYNERADAPPLPEHLAFDISRTEASIDLYEQTLARTRMNQEALEAAFASDIARFKQLKGG